MIITLFRLLLGGVFLITGLSKIPIFGAFTYSITDLIPVSGTPLVVLAVLTIAFEITAGAALLIRKLVPLFSALLALMLTAFIVALSVALFRYEHYICNCFGVLGLELPVYGQIIVDLILLTLALSVFFFDGRKRGAERFYRRYAIGTMTTTAVLSVIWGLLVLLQPVFVFGEKPELTINDRLIFSVADRSSDIDRSRPILIQMVNFGDFMCPQCFDDFMYLGGRISGHPVDLSHNVITIAQRFEFMSPEEQWEYIEDWRYMQEYPLTMQLDERNLFDQSGLDKSMILLYSGSGALIDYAHLPMGSRRRSEMADIFLR
jgi:uncharacterized membrane protein YphA (DoxX/SURF4 family)